MSEKKVVGVEAYLRPLGDRSLSLDETYFFWAGVRSADYFPSYHRERKRLARQRRVRELRDWAVLVAEPENDYDPFAVGVYSGGVQVGYVAATVAEFMHWHIRQFEVRGIRLVVPLLLTYGPQPGDEDDFDEDGRSWFGDIYSDDYPSGTWAALPTLQELDKHSDWDAAEKQLFEIWDKMPKRIQHSLVGTFLEQNTELMDYLKSARRDAPLAAIPYSSDPGALPPQVRGFFLDRRLEVRLEKERLRRQAMDERNQAIASRVGEGHSVNAVAEQFGLSETTVRRVAKEKGVVPAPSATAASLARAERCRRAASLADSGKTIAEVARTLDVSSGTAQSLVTDGRFYQDPSRSWDRLALAQGVASGEKPPGGASSWARRRSRTDARILASLFPRGDWLTAGRGAAPESAASADASPDATARSGPELSSNAGPEAAPLRSEVANSASRPIITVRIL